MRREHVAVAAPLTVTDPIQARWFLRALVRDLRTQVVNGGVTPDWAQQVLQQLADTANLARPDIGTTPVNVSSSPTGRLTSVQEAAAMTGLSEEYIRRLARTRQVLAQRAGQRTWLIDIDSLKGVTNGSHQDQTKH